MWKSHFPDGFGDIFYIYPQCFPKFPLWAAEASGCRCEHHPRCVLSTCSLIDEQLLDKACQDLATCAAEHWCAAPHCRGADLDPWGASPAHSSRMGRADLPSRLAAFTSKPQRLALCVGE